MPAKRFLALVVVLLVASFFASATLADVLQYVGETPTSGITWYSGANASNSLWDYVYNITGWLGFTDNSGPSQIHTSAWGIVVGSPISQTLIWSPDHWTGIYYSSTPYISGLSDLQNRQAVVWTYDLSGSGTATGFHFQSSYSPVLQLYEGTGGGGGNIGTGDQWSASVPEPGTLALASLCLLGGYARRRWPKDATRRAT